MSIIVARLTSYESASNPSEPTRVFELLDIWPCRLHQGFPADVDAKCRLSVLPLIFQEANYDDLDWSEKDSDLGHLSDMIRIDFADVVRWTFPCRRHRGGAPFVLRKRSSVLRPLS